jgi:hypothetical protein
MLNMTQKHRSCSTPGKKLASEDVLDKIKSKLTNTNICVSNLEDSKSGNVETTIMVKNKVYRGGGDIAAELATWFPAGTKLHPRRQHTRRRRTKI